MVVGSGGSVFGGDVEGSLGVGMGGEVRGGMIGQILIWITM